MKTIITSGIVMSVIGVLAVSTIFKPDIIEVKNNVSSFVEVEKTVEVKQPLDVIDEAKKELERINAELDSEETRLLEEIETINAEAKNQVDERKARLERIRETRSSFQ